MPRGPTKCVIPTRYITPHPLPPGICLPPGFKRSKVFLLSATSHSSVLPLSHFYGRQMPGTCFVALEIQRGVRDGACTQESSEGDQMWIIHYYASFVHRSLDN